LQISVNGESGSGKSHGLKTHLHLVPKKWKRETSLSAKAAYFMDLAPGMILFSDDKDPDSDFEEVIKRATTNFQKEHDIFLLVV
jgi:primase-polymerase (primpol)-like protein